MKEKFEQFIKYFKFIFILGVIILVIIEFSKLQKEVSLEELKLMLASLGLTKFIILGSASLLAITPMLNYDFLFCKMVGIEKSKKEILSRSITINTFNNLIGFGGLINTGLRYQYFEDETDKNIMPIVLKILMFYFLGCSFLALIGLSYLLVTKDPYIIKYWPWLLGGVLYYPVTILVSKYKNGEKHYFSLSYIMGFSMTSLLEWLGALSFFLLIGYFLGVNLNVMTVMTVFVIANLIGIVSMLPGGLGSFDLIVVGVFTAMGLNHELTLSWLLLYRLFYYVIPFIIGVVFFIRNTEGLLDRRKDSILAQIVRSFNLDIFASMLYLLGILFIFSVTIPDKLIGVKWLSEFNHIHANIIYQSPSILLGYLCIFLGRANKEKIKKAFWPSCLTLSLALGYVLVTGFGVFMFAYLVACIILCVMSRKQLYRKQLVYSLENITKDVCLTLFVLGVSLLEFLKNYNLFHRHKVHDFLVIPFEHAFLRICFYLVILFVAIYGLIYYLKGSRVKIGEKADFLKIDDLLKHYPASTTAALAYLGDKDMYYFKDEDGCIQAALQCFTFRDRVAVMGEPFGDEAYYEPLINQFIKETDLYGYDPIFYEVSADMTMTLHDYGFQFMKFGESAMVDLEVFSIVGNKGKPMRNVLNKFDKAGMTFEVVSPPHSPMMLVRLEEISNLWLNGREEKGFSLGFFDRDYLNKCDIALVKNNDNQIIAFANIMPNLNSNVASIDLMRFDDDQSPNGAMDFLFLKLFLHSQSIGKRYFDLGMTPLANVGVNENSFVREKIAFLIYRFGDQVYSFEGLRKYKQKFAPEWLPVYTSYSKKSWLPYTMWTIFHIDSIAPVKK